ncbi:MAG: hypothetical protein ACTSRI_10450 [Promethearchaeota archaeon]
MNKKLKEIIVEKVKKNKSYGFGIYERLNSDYSNQEVHIHARGCFFLEVEQSKGFSFQIFACEGNFSMSSSKLELFYNFRTGEELFVFLEAFLDSFKDFNHLYDYIFCKFNFIKKTAIEEDYAAFESFGVRYSQFQKII